MLFSGCPGVPPICFQAAAPLPRPFQAVPTQNSSCCTKATFAQLLSLLCCSLQLPHSSNGPTQLHITKVFNTALTLHSLCSQAAPMLRGGWVGWRGVEGGFKKMRRGVGEFGRNGWELEKKVLDIHGCQLVHCSC